MEIIFNKVCYKNKITKKFILKDISFKINDGINAFIGPSGSGKTTILKLLETMIFPDLGTIKINGFISYEEWTNLIDNLFDYSNKKEIIKRVKEFINKRNKEDEIYQNKNEADINRLNILYKDFIKFLLEL